MISRTRLVSAVVLLAASHALAQPSAASALYEAQNLVKEKGSADEAKSNCRKALDMLAGIRKDDLTAPEAALARYLTGICLIRLDRRGEAAEPLEDVVYSAADPGMRESALWHLGFVRLETLDQIKAKEAYERLLREFPESRRRDEVAGLLAPLKLVGTKAPAFKAKDLQGNDLDLKALSGRIVLLSFWATWCPPCRREMPEVKVAHDRYKGDGLATVGISLDTDRAALADFLKRNGMDWPHYCDEKKWQCPLARIYGVSSVPMAFLIDRRGVVRCANLRGESLRRAIALLLKEP